MIKVKLNLEDGRKIIILGLSDLNIEKLKQGNDIEILEPLISDHTIVITHGKTQQDIIDRLDFLK